MAAAGSSMSSWPGERHARAASLIDEAIGLNLNFLEPGRAASGAVVRPSLLVSLLGHQSKELGSGRCGKGHIQGPGDGAQGCP